MTNFEKLKKLIEASDLPAKNAFGFVKFWSFGSETDLGKVLKLCENDKSWIKKLYSSYQQKMKALQQKDLKLWKAIIDEEEKELERIAKNKSE